MVSLEAARAAAAGGAQRLELCTDLAHGGTTPDMQLLRECRARLSIPIFVLVRPRAGDFVYSGAEQRLMLEQIQQAKDAGAQGIVTGALSADHEIDQRSTTALLAAARPLPVTFHRAFDACHDFGASLDQLIQLGIPRVLTSGGARTAAEGAEQIGQLVERAQGRIEILAGGGVAASNVARLVSVSGVREIHFSVTDAEKVRGVMRALM